MEIEIGSFAREGLETRVGPGLGAAINAALVYYVGKSRSGRIPAPYPRFLGESAEAGTVEGGLAARRAGAIIEVSVDERIEAALDTEAGRQGVGIAQLAGHAVLVFLAELDLIGDPPAVAGQSRN
jgi:hypothetical protein